MPKETLLERLQREAKEKLSPNVEYIDPKFEEVASWAQELLNAFWIEQQKDLDQVIAHTLKEAAEALEGMKGISGVTSEAETYLEYERREYKIKVRNEALTDAQRLLGEDKK